MKEDYLQVGDIVKCKRWDGSTGHELEKYGRGALFTVLSIERHKTSVEEWIARVIPVGRPDRAPLGAHWDRFIKVELMAEPDFSLEDIHKAQEMVK